MPVKLSEFPSLIGRNILVQEEDESQPEGYREVAGKCAAATAKDGIVLRLRGRTHIIPTDKIIDIIPEGKSRKMSIHQVGPVQEGGMRQHLLDRHGYTLPRVEAMTEELALVEHALISHEGLGHRHTPRQRTAPVELRSILIPSMTEEDIRQHLASRHGVPVDVAKLMEISVAMSTHEKLHYSPLGHYHPDGPIKG